MTRTLVASRSLAPWVAVAIYQPWVAYWIYHARTCVGWVCDLESVVALAPGSVLSGLIFAAVNDLYVLGRVVTIRNWAVIAGTVVIDAILIYLVVTLIVRFARRRAGRRATPPARS